MGLEMKEMRSCLPQIGAVEWIGLRVEKRGEIRVVESTETDENGLTGDFFNGPPQAPRQVTLIQAEHVEAVASLLGRDSVDPVLLRRNIVVRGINLQALKDREFSIGECKFFATGNCPPCSLMEENLGAGGYNAMRGHGGITAYVTQFGSIKVGDEVKVATMVANDSQPDR